ncbi:MAG: zinc ribbon domain-containing protein [Ignavibacteriaceae bacterium]|nr:zinc ribbon domain-containing protein [Ignavibacteriaceae bacterium]
MPTYEYKCLSCNDRFELFQSMTAEPIKKCPKCSGEVKRLIGAGAGPIFKGTGFYQTDYKNSSTKNSTAEKKEKSESTKPPVSEKPTDKKAG